MGLVKTINELVLDERGAYALSDRLADHPLPHDVLFFDCPATLGPLSLIALSASTHILVPVQVEPKSVHGSAELFTYIFTTIRKLRLRPEPKILGIVPTQFDANVAIHRRLKDALTPVTERMGLRYFPPVRYSTEFKNCSEVGLPLHLFRPKSKAVKDFDPIVDAIAQALLQEQIVGELKQ
jgi:chromosome partitioning protein